MDGGEGEGLKLDTQFTLLADSTRRQLLLLLRQTDDPIHLADLARAIADSEHRENDPEHVYISLYHTHVPELADAGLVSFDSDRQTVTLCTIPEPMASHLTAADSE